MHVVKVVWHPLYLFHCLFPLPPGCWAIYREGGAIRWEMPGSLNPSMGKIHLFAGYTTLGWQSQWEIRFYLVEMFLLLQIMWPSLMQNLGRQYIFDKNRTFLLFIPTFGVLKWKPVDTEKRTNLKSRVMNGWGRPVTNFMSLNILLFIVPLIAHSLLKAFMHVIESQGHGANTTLLLNPLHYFPALISIRSLTCSRRKTENKQSI